MWVSLIITLLASWAVMIYFGVLIGWSDFEFYAKQLKTELEYWKLLCKSYEEIMRKRGENNESR